MIIEGVDQGQKNQYVSRLDVSSLSTPASPRLQLLRVAGVHRHTISRSQHAPSLHLSVDADARRIAIITSLTIHHSHAALP